MKRETPRTVELGPLTLRADVQPESLDEAARTVDMVFSTGAPVQRFDWMSGERYVETLAIKPEAVRLERLNKGAPFLNAHSSWDVGDVLGVVVEGSARIEKGQALATVRLSRRSAVEPIWQDIRDGILRNVSVGYRVYKYEQSAATPEKPLTRLAVDWEPFEISSVPIAADADAQLRSAASRSNVSTNPCAIIQRAGHEETRAMIDDVARDEKPQDLTHQPGDPGAPAAASAESAGQPATEQSERQAGSEAERQRVQGIIKAVRNAGFASSMADRFIADATMTLEKAQGAVLEELGKLDRGALPRSTALGVTSVGGMREIGSIETHVRGGIENALLHRVAPQWFKLDDLGRSYVGSSLLDCARYCLQARGVRTTGMSKMEVAGASLGLNQRAAMHTTSDFAEILADVANKTLRQAYNEAPQTFTAIGRRVTLPDFKPVRRLQIGEAPQLLEVLEHGEFTRGTIGEGKEQFQLATYGRVFAITRKALVNDDTDAFSRVAMLFGRSARNLESGLVWGQITGNPVMGDTVELFHATHGNLSGTSDAIAVASIGAGRTAMRTQRAVDGVEFLNIAPRYLIVPAAKETIADQFVSTALMAAQSSNVNPFAGRLQVIAEPRLDAVSGVSWYLAASPDQIDMIEYGSLAGEEGPAVETRVGFDVDGLEVKCRHDFAAKVIDHRGFYKNPGA